MHLITPVDWPYILYIVTNSFFLVDSQGLPLSIQLEWAKSKGVAVSLPHFYRDALKAGWKPKKALTKIEEALVDCGQPREYIDAAIAWLENHKELPSAD
jgi:hypothetical protein